MRIIDLDPGDQRAIEQAAALIRIYHSLELCRTMVLLRRGV